MSTGDGYRPDRGACSRWLVARLRASNKSLRPTPPLRPGVAQLRLSSTVIRHQRLGKVFLRWLAERCCVLLVPTLGGTMRVNASPQQGEARWNEPYQPADGRPAGGQGLYVGKLGFRVTYEATEDGKSGVLGLQRGGFVLHLDAPMGGHGRNVVVTLEVDDTDALYDHMSGSDRTDRWVDLCLFLSDRGQKGACRHPFHTSRAGGLHRIYGNKA